MEGGLHLPPESVIKVALPSVGGAIASIPGPFPTHCVGMKR
jgi:hypothetical protein